MTSLALIGLCNDFSLWMRIYYRFIKEKIVQEIKIEYCIEVDLLHAYVE